MAAPWARRWLSLGVAAVLAGAQPEPGLLPAGRPVTHNSSSRSAASSGGSEDRPAAGNRTARARALEEPEWLAASPRSDAEEDELGSPTTSAAERPEQPVQALRVVVEKASTTRAQERTELPERAPRVDVEEDELEGSTTSAAEHVERPGEETSRAAMTKASGAPAQSPPPEELPVVVAAELRGAPAAPAGERPKPTFPGATPAESHAAWASGRQPTPLAAWPRLPSGKPASCWKKPRVLQDINLGWPGACQGLSRTSAINALDCHESCARDPLCAVWKYNLMTQCSQGVGEHCGDVGGSDLLTMGSQRLLHGDVEVLMDLSGWEIRGLRAIGDTSWGSGNDTLGLENCRAWCYSNLHCQFWQYGNAGCLAEDRGWAVTYPLTTSKDGNARHNTTAARSMMGGEYIQHVCRSPASDGAAGPSLPLATDDGQGPAIVQWAWSTACLAAAVAAGYQVWSLLRLNGPAYSSSSGLFLREQLSDGASTDEEELDSPVEEKPCDADVASGWLRFPLVPLHTFLQPGHVDGLVRGGLATAAERRAVRQVAPEAPPTLANFLAWRRLSVAMLLMVGAIYYVTQCCILLSTKRHSEYFDELSRRPDMANYQAFVSGGATEFSFLQYSEQKLLTLLAGVLAEVLRGASFVEVVVCTMELLPLVCLAAALFHWTSFARSRHYILRAWFLAFLTPFFVSLFPMRLIVSFSETELQVDRYIHELAVALHLDKAQQLLLGGCGHVLNQEFDEKIERVGNKLRTTCNSLSNFPLQLAVPCLDSLSLCHVDLGEAADGCREAMGQFDMGHVDAASSIVKSECAKIQQAFVAGQGSAEERQRGRLRAFSVLLDMMRMPFHTLVPSIEVVSITVSALHAFLMVLPPFTGIAPGFVCGGIATKGLIPHSELPGAIIMIVPIVTASITWVASTALFQYVSHTWTLCFIVVILSFPLSFVVISTLHQMTKPTPKDVLLRGMRALHASTGASALFMLLLAWKILSDAVGQTASVPGLVQLMDWCNVGWGQLTFSGFVHMLYSFMLTSFGATDWMISDISAQQRYWHFWLSKDGKPEEAPRSSPQKRHSSRLRSRSSVGTPTTPYRSARLNLFFQQQDSGLLEARGGSPDELKNSDLCELLRHQLMVARVGERGESAEENVQWSP